MARLWPWFHVHHPFIRASQVAVVVKKPPVSAGDRRDVDSVPGLERSPGGGNGNPLQYFCLENPRDRGAWWAIVHGVACMHYFIQWYWDSTDYLVLMKAFGHAECFSSTILFQVEPCNAVFSVSSRASQLTLVVKNLPADAGDIRDPGSIPGSRRSPGGGHGNALQYFCLENSMDTGAWWATVCKVAKSQTQSRQLSSSL